MKILLVEDNEVNRQVIRAMLGSADLDVDEAENAYIGLTMIDRYAYDLVLMDLRMPGMSGLDAIKVIRQRADAKASVPILVVTADTAKNLRELCTASGANGLIPKPVSIDTLFDQVGAVMVAKSPEHLLL